MSEVAMNESTYHDQIRVSVEPNYLDDESAPDENRFVFSYTVTITNQGEAPAQLLSRHWIITNGDTMDTQEVKGQGVIGQQPKIEPGESYTYTSGTVMEAPVGTMHGSYHMVSTDGTQFDVTIDPFMLAAPGSLH